MDLVNFLDGKTRSRFIHNDDFGSEKQRSCNGHRLALSTREVVHSFSHGIEIDFQFSEDFPGFPFHPLLIQNPKGSPQKGFDPGSP